MGGNPWLVLVPMQLNEIHALIQLLDDPDEGVYSHVRERLMERGSDLLPVLERHRAQSLLAGEHASRLDDHERLDRLHGHPQPGRCRLCGKRVAAPRRMRKHACDDKEGCQSGTRLT